MVKRDSRTIVFDVSSHGFGHLGQIAPVIIELIAQHPTARVVVRNTHAASVVKNILGFDVDLDEPPPEAVGSTECSVQNASTCVRDCRSRRDHSGHSRT